MLNVNGLTITVACAAGPTLSATANTTVDGAQFQSSSATSGDGLNGDGANPDSGRETTNEILDDNFTIAENKNLVGEDTDFQQGTTSYTNPNGEHVTVHWTADDFATGPDCEFTGFAFAS